MLVWEGKHFCHPFPCKTRDLYVAADARRDKVRPQARRAHTAGGRGNVQPPAGRAHTAARRTAGGRDKVPPQAGRTCEQSMRRPAALARTHAGIRYACTAARRGNVQPPAGRAHTAARRTAGGRDKVRPILISCEHSLLAGEAWFETKVCIRRENPCTQDMPHASIPARGARGSDGGGRGAKKEN